MSHIFGAYDIFHYGKMLELMLDILMSSNNRGTSLAPLLSGFPAVTDTRRSICNGLRVWYVFIELLPCEREVLRSSVSYIQEDFF